MLAHVVSCFVFFRSLLFICSAIFFFLFLCREIPENILVDNYRSFHTMNYNSRKPNFYNSHAQREMTLAFGGKESKNGR